LFRKITMAHSDDSKRSKVPPKPPTDNPTTHAQQVWLAGLSAMAKAQEQGSKAMEALVNDGLAFQRKSQAQAQQRLHEATERMSHLASDFGQQASGRVDKLEHLFEDRVAKALHRLGMPTLLDIQVLTDRVAQLELQLAAALPPPATRAKSGPSKSASKSAPSAAPRSAAQAAVKSAGKASAPKTRNRSA
jgi:poly(hydroxyalkanoate) granule-associated protein